MSTSRSLVKDVMQGALPMLSEHWSALGGLATRLSVVRHEFVQGWGTEIEKEPALAAPAPASDWLEDASVTFVANLAALNPAEYLAGVARWSEGWCAIGATFSETLVLLSTWRRAMLPFLASEYRAGPELELLFRALDSLERALVSVLAAAEIESLEDELARGNGTGEPRGAQTRLSPSERNMRILVVDDEPLVRDVSARSFELRGFETAVAGSGADAISLYGTHGPYDIVIVDMVMPDMSGLETSRAIHELDSRALILLMTAWANEPGGVELREAGVHRTISKPFQVEQVIELLKDNEP